jgi:hypothetical protein
MDTNSFGFALAPEQRSALTGVFFGNNPATLGGFSSGEFFSFGINGVGLYGIQTTHMTPPNLPNTGAILSGPQTELEFTIDIHGYNFNGSSFQNDVAPFVHSDTEQTMLPLRVVAERLGATVEWIELTRTAVIYLPGRTLIVQADSPLPGNMGTPVIVNNRILVPYSYVTSILGANVMFDNQTVIVRNASN